MTIPPAHNHPFSRTLFHIITTSAERSFTIQENNLSQEPWTDEAEYGLASPHTSAGWGTGPRIGWCSTPRGWLWESP